MQDQKWFTVKNWKKFQHYKDRNPIWIKLHISLLSDYNFNVLAPRSQLILIKIWICCAITHDNRLLDDQKWLKFQLKLKGKIDLKPLFDAGFLEYCENLASKTLENCEQPACLETETEKRTETEVRDRGEEKRELALVTQPPQIETLWNEHCGALPKTIKATPKRIKSWFHRWSERPDEAYWIDVIQKMAASGFCCGENKAGWQATIDFLLRPDTHVKVMEGTYDSKKKNGIKNNLEAFSKVIGGGSDA